jgi:hypothetical protein
MSSFLLNNMHSTQKGKKTWQNLEMPEVKEWGDFAHTPVSNMFDELLNQ